MNELSAFAITQKWPARHPDCIQLYSLPTAVIRGSKIPERGAKPS